MGKVTAVEPLSEEECYLATILMDKSGIDIAEFLWHAPENNDGCFRAWPFQWCFAGETPVITKFGVRPIRDLLGSVTLLTEGASGCGKWIEAEVAEFGLQEIWEVHLERYGLTKTIRTTENHRWFGGSGRRRDRQYSEITTRDLEVGTFLKHVRPQRAKHLQVTPYGVVHGLVWGDGTREGNGGCHLNLWGEDLQACEEFMLGPGTVLNRPDVSVPGKTWSLLPYHFKEPVSFSESSSYLYSWLMGYFSADGSVSPDGTCVLESVSKPSMELVRDVCIRLGITVGPIISLAERWTDYGSNLVYRVTIVGTDLTEEFFLKQSHLKKWKTQGSLRCRPREWKVVGVNRTETVEPVYCAIVPGTHSFVLEDYILTGNCWWRCDDALQIDQCARSVGKSLGIKVRLFAFPFVYPNQEATITAPELVHLEPIVKRVEQQFDSTRLGREIRKKLPTHRPFHYEFKNGANILGRIPQRDGKGVKGIHSLVLEQDESSDYPEPGWKELIETRLQGVESIWRSHGVSKGMGTDSFYKRSQHGQDDPPLRYVSRPGLTTVHRIVAMARPTWSDAEREEKIMEYGSKDDPDFRRNLLGTHGDAQSPIIVLSRLMKCVDDDPSSEYNTDDFWRISLKDSELDRMREINPAFDLVSMFIPPPSHASYKTIWIGADLGWTIDPTEILIAAEYPMDAEEKNQSKVRKKAMPKTNRLKIVGRISLNRIATPDQEEIFLSLIDAYNPAVFAMDATGAGLPIYQAIQRRVEDTANRTGSLRAKKAVSAIRGYNFSSKVLAEFDESIEDDPKWTLEEKIREKGIKRDVLELSTDVLRSYVDDERLWLPWDLNLIEQFRAQTFTINKAARDQYGRKRVFSNGNFHALDAARMLALGHSQFAIESLLRAKEPPTEPVLDVFMSW